MKIATHILALVGCTLAAAAPASSQQLGDPERGLAAAQRLCADCHDVAPGGTSSPMARAPTFERIAQIRGMTTMALSAWIHSSHQRMPLVIVDAPTIADLSAYLSALKASADVAGDRRTRP